MKYLVIVESPSKCKKIEEYLNEIDDLNIYEVIATMGHITELKSLENIDIKNDFNPTYELIEAKKKNTELIRKKIKTVNEVILACDDDIEGQSINYYVCKEFNLSLEKTKRILFNEITKSALKKAIENPKLIDMNIVYTQRARQILDLLVGFKITPMLWKYVSQNSENSLSAGRCQTPALKLIYDNQQNINKLEERKIYNTIGYFTTKNIPFELNKNFESEDEMTNFLNEISKKELIYTCSSPIKVFKTQPDPFITSTIQQESSNQFHFSPKETMKICQKLYENGYITYMRTDSKTYCKEFIDNVKEYILRNYEEKYINEQIDNLNEREKIKDNKKQLKEQDKKKQEAHEAIRPTNMYYKELPDIFDSKEKKIYKLIWENTLESCMSPAIYYSIIASIQSSFKNIEFIYKSELLDFLGWQIVTKKNIENKEYHYLQSIKQNSTLQYKKIYSKMNFINKKQHYTEAKLVNLLEENGIGRPSTFSSLVDKIQERGYVKKEDIKGIEINCNDYELVNEEIFEINTKREFGNEKGKLIIQPLGIIVIEFLEKHFNNLFDYNYTKQMENDLDEILIGNKLWSELCKNCNNNIDFLLKKTKDELKNEKIEIKIDKNHFFIIGKFGPIIKCIDLIDGKETISFKAINKDIDICKLQNGEYKLEDIIDKNNGKTENIVGKFENNDVIIKKGKYGLYMSWGEKTRPLKELGNRPIENITFADIELFLNEETSFIRKISNNISIRKSKKGDYIFFKSTKMNKPQFYDLKNFKEDYKNCDLEVLKTWIKDTFNIY
jgi:DNA topoisomerase-1